VRCSPDNQERTLITVDPVAGEVIIDSTAASLDAEVLRPDPLVRVAKGQERVDTPVQRAPLALPAGEPLRLHIFVDRSIVEVFVNERVCLTSRIYPTRDDAIGITVAGQGQVHIRGWRLAVAHAV
jgi:beta-fructofuranosidase